MREECITPHHYGAAAVARPSWRTLHSPRLPCVGGRQRCAPCSVQQKPWLRHPLRRRFLSVHVRKVPGIMGAGADIHQKHPQRVSKAPCEGCLVASAEAASPVLPSALGVRAPASPDLSSAGLSAR